MMKKILIPTDFSDNAKHALSYAIELENNSDVVFHIFHSVPQTFVESPNGAILNAILLQETKTVAKNRVADLASFATDLIRTIGGNDSVAETSVEIGDPLYTIKSKASEINADFIIMGTLGANHSGLQRIFGSVSKSMINNAPCPVILIPSDYKYKTIDKIIFASNLKESEPFNLWRAIHVLKPFNPEIRCLHVSKDVVSEIKYQALAKYIEEANPDSTTKFTVRLGDKPDEVIEKYLNLYHADLIVMQRSKMNLIQKLLRVNLPNKVVDKLNIPLMVLNEN